MSTIILFGIWILVVSLTSTTTLQILAAYGTSVITSIPLAYAINLVLEPGTDVITRFNLALRATYVLELVVFQLCTGVWGSLGVLAHILLQEQRIRRALVRERSTAF